MVSVIALSACSPNRSPASAERPELVSGKAFALDGDTIKVGDRIVDLWAVDAGSTTSTTGWFARVTLDDILDRDSKVVCKVRVQLRGRVQGICSSNRAGDVGRAIIRNGWALVSRRVFLDNADDVTIRDSYHRAEATARRLRLGQWSLMPVR
jgi:endonuclease YncB( thermonuclease family)